MNRGFEYRETLTRRNVAPGLTVLEFLSRRHAHSSPAEWLERIRRGRVLLDGRRANADASLVAGQTLVWKRPPWREPEAPLHVVPLFQDRHLIAVAKPAGLPTLPGGGYLEHTLLARVRTIDADAVPVHRLGRWTSGLVLFARTAKARTALASSWRNGAVTRRYRALASGSPLHLRFAVDHPIGPVPHGRLGTVHAACTGGKVAGSRVRVLELRAREFLAEVTIETGRPHQVRIHLAAAGHPLVGDPLYPVGGRPDADCPALPGDPGYQLHATYLAVPHPVDGRPLELRAAPPPGLRAPDRPAWPPGRGDLYSPG